MSWHFRNVRIWFYGMKFNFETRISKQIRNCVIVARRFWMVSVMMLYKVISNVGSV